MTSDEVNALAVALAENGADNQLIDAVADVCERDPRFDRGKFFDTAGGITVGADFWNALDDHARGEGGIVRIVS